MVSINLGIWFYGVETGDAGESIEPEESHYIRGFPIKVRKQVGDVVQLVRTLLSHRHNDVGDSKISRLAQTTSVRPVTVSAISLHFRKLVVRSLEDPDVVLLQDRSASRLANSFRQELIAELFDEES